MQLKIEHKIELKINSGVLLINNILEGLYFELQIGLFIKPTRNRGPWDGTSRPWTVLVLGQNRGLLKIPGLSHGPLNQGP